MDFKGKNILVTGGAGIGVGAGVREALHQSGARLILVDIDPAALAAAKKKYPDASCYQVDIRSAQEVENLFRSLEIEFTAIHGLVNNAGTGLSKEAHIADEEEFDRLTSVNIKAVWMCSRHFVRLLLERGQSGHIVNIASVHAHATQAKFALYSTTKNAIKGLTMGMAVELGKHNIRVNAVGPGYVNAEQNFDLIRTWTDDPEGWVEKYRKYHQVIERLIDPVDVGHVVAFLLSEEARAVTGQLIYVDNGATSLLFNRDFTE